MKFKWLLILLLGIALAGCSSLGKGSQALPTVVLDTGTSSTTPQAQATTQASMGGVTASGNVAPAQQAELTFTSGGNVETITVQVGDSVKAGDVLVRLAGAEKLTAAVEAANLELLSAQQELLDAQQARQDLDTNLPQAQTDALQTLNDARQALKDAQQKAAGLRIAPSQADLNEAYATLVLTKDKLNKAQKDYDQVNHSGVKNVIQAALLNKLAQAQRDYDNALRRYNNLKGGSTEFYSNQTLTELDIAQKRLDQAQSDYDTLLKGPKPEYVATADARVETAQGRITAAQASLKSAQADLSNLELKAPFDGTIGDLNVHSGEWVVPGEPIVTLADLAHLQVETTDLSERDVPQVKVGQPVTILIKPLNQDVSGRVVQIAPLSSEIGGDVVYKTTIDLDTIPDGLRSGMSVDVQFGS
jgi:HlyD family secretion protein